MAYSYLHLSCTFSLTNIIMKPPQSRVDECATHCDVIDPPSQFCNYRNKRQAVLPRAVNSIKILLSEEITSSSTHPNTIQISLAVGLGQFPMNAFQIKMNASQLISFFNWKKACNQQGSSCIRITNSRMTTSMEQKALGLLLVRKKNPLQNNHPPRSLTYIQHELETKNMKQIQTNKFTSPCVSWGHLG